MYVNCVTSGGILEYQNLSVLKLIQQLYSSKYFATGDVSCLLVSAGGARVVMLRPFSITNWHQSPQILDRDAFIMKESGSDRKYMTSFRGRETDQRCVVDSFHTCVTTCMRNSYCVAGDIAILVPDTCMVLEVLFVMFFAFPRNGSVRYDMKVRG